MRYLLFLLVFIPNLIFSEVKFCLYTCPKCGTHLLMNVIQEITGKSPKITPTIFCHINFDFMKEAQNTNKFVCTHEINEWQFRTFNKENYKFIVIYRDPRDNLISFMYWLKKSQPSHHIHPIQFLSINDQIKELISGEIYGYPAFDLIDIRLRNSSQIAPGNLLMVKFEDLIGPKGGGDFNKQINTILEIGNFLGIPLTNSRSEEISYNSWGHSNTFREGIIGQWRNYFNQEHIELYKEKYGQKLIELGYEKDLNW